MFRVNIALLHNLDSFGAPEHFQKYICNANVNGLHREGSARMSLDLDPGHIRIDLLYFLVKTSPP